MPKLTVCGGGNAAHVLIAMAAHAGWEVDVLAPMGDEARRLRRGMAGGGITARFPDRVITGRARCVSAEPAEVVPESDWILLALPAFAHGAMLRAVLPHLKPGAWLGALPARGGFDYEARFIMAAGRVGQADLPPPGALDLENLVDGLTLFGLQTLPWACRIITYGQEVAILGVKAAVDLAALPADAAPSLARQLASLFELPLNPVSSFLTLTLANTGQLIHPGIMYGLCRGREEDTFAPDDVPLFYQGVDGTTADVLQAMSEEVQLISRSLATRLPGFDPQEVLPLHPWLLRAYPNAIGDGRTLQSAFVTNRAYAGLRLPTRSAGSGTRMIDFSARYLAEDVPYGLVVVRGIAELAGVSTPMLDEVIVWAQARLGRRYLVDGRLAGRDLLETRAPQIYGIHTPARLGA